MNSCPILTLRSLLVVLHRRRRHYYDYIHFLSRGSPSLTLPLRPKSTTCKFVAPAEFASIWPIFISVESAYTVWWLPHLRGARKLYDSCCSPQAKSFRALMLAPKLDLLWSVELTFRSNQTYIPTFSRQSKYIHCRSIRWNFHSIQKCVPLYIPSACILTEITWSYVSTVYSRLACRNLYVISNELYTGRRAYKFALSFHPCIYIITMCTVSLSEVNLYWKGYFAK